MPTSDSRSGSNSHGHGNHNTSDGSNEGTPLIPSLLRGQVAHEGESGRHGFHPRHFLNVTYKSSNLISQYVNFLWPFVPLTIIFRYALPNHPLFIFAFAYIGMIPSANLLGFAGQEFAKKLPKVAGILIETTFGSIVEIILFTVLIVKHREPDKDEENGNGDEGNLIPIIQAAILGSILTNLLLCLGLCFFVGGLRQSTQKLHAAVSETGNGRTFRRYLFHVCDGIRTFTVLSILPALTTTPPTCKPSGPWRIGATTPAASNAAPPMRPASDRC